MLLVIKIFVIGLLLVGCQEGTNKSPVSALFTSEDLYGGNGYADYNEKNGSINGKLTSKQTNSGPNGVYAFLYEWKESSKPISGNTSEVGYELGEFVASTMTYDSVIASSPYSLIGTSNTGGNFEFSKLVAGNYCLYFGKTSNPPETTTETRPGNKSTWIVFKTDSPDYIHSIRDVKVEANKELTILVSY